MEHVPLACKFNIVPWFLRIQLRFVNGASSQPSQHDHDLCAEFMEQLPKLLEEGRIRPNQAKVYQNGLDDVSKGFQEFRDGKVSNYKIVYKV